MRNQLWTNGDLNQMANQREALRRNGFNVKTSDVYAYVEEDEATKALKMFWEQSIPGWWHFEEMLIEEEICTKEEILNKLRRE